MCLSRPILSVRSIAVTHATEIVSDGYRLLRLVSWVLGIAHKEFATVCLLLGSAIAFIVHVMTSLGLVTPAANEVTLFVSLHPWRLNEVRAGARHVPASMTSGTSLVTSASALLAFATQRQRWRGSNSTRCRHRHNGGCVQVLEIPAFD